MFPVPPSHVGETVTRYNLLENKFTRRNTSNFTPRSLQAPETVKDLHREAGRILVTEFRQNRNNLAFIPGPLDVKPGPLGFNLKYCNMIY